MSNHTFLSSFFTVCFAAIGASAQVHTSNTGAVFARDISNPALGEAYRDPSGLVWGSIVMDQGKPRIMTKYDADKYCRSVGGRLPTEGEADQLARYLGKGTNSGGSIVKGYTPYSVENFNVEVLPELSSYWFWSSSIHPSIPDDGLALYFGVFNIYFLYINSGSLGPVRCVGSRL
jgi:hypothetical protein